MIAIILGPQGSGKGTQAAVLRDRLGMLYIASGDVLRSARASDTELGAVVRRYMDDGHLVPDEITVRLILEIMPKAPADRDTLLDGFPRTVAQAEALDEALTEQGRRIEVLIELIAPLEVVKGRLQSRLVCRTCGAVYNSITAPPKVEGKCDLDGGELYRREDDNPDAIDRRLAIWERQNTELLEYYDGRVEHLRVDADRAAAAVADELVDELTRHKV